ncbi:myogenesis-regulating glycosidase-like isoform X2 [Anthonomus grandis grandis]|uniref:myogenesis-regulating glycosidase-like isoform X2 n=1 Tax=Anthonomus grandis grandis TaxID=2921223 RepID=UPI0021650EAB|nr:myogenesis-regulating glycosidase-like isoform X2 [Anthonomus grandis grandis]
MLEKGKTFFLLVCLILKSQGTPSRKMGTGIVDLYLDFTTNGINFDLKRQNISKMTGTIGSGFDFTHDSPVDYEVTIIDVDNGFRIEWVSNNTSLVITDCLNLQKGTLNWYGGPQIYQQEWPIEKLQLSGNDPYVLRKASNFAVPERYWLNSIGAFIYIDERVPLFVDQNLGEKACFIAKNQGPYVGRERLIHRYHLIAMDDPVSAHKYAAMNFWLKPQYIPNEKMISEPIWTTWAKYKKNIDENMVREFSYDILNHGFKGQIEIDEQWETCFGSRVFIPDKFGNISNIVKDLQDKNFRVTLWAAPFVNLDCTALVEEGERNGYFVKNTEGNMSTVWWESNDARQIDFTKENAREWYAEKLRKLLQDPGVDGFKFDAGETDYVAQPAVYNNEDPELVPNIFSQRYIDTIAEFGNLIEARSAFRTQNYGIFLRMIDKDSLWGLDDGLQSLVTTLLQLNMVGYSFVLPDMIGGNGYRAQPTLELLIRWTQATVFMPSMQFSYLPWDFSEDAQLNGTEIIRSFIELHEKYSPQIIAALQGTVRDQTPANPPIWWIAPDDEIALQTYDEYLLGDSILVAPVMEEGATARSVYLPNGTWLDGTDGTTTYDGPITLNYNAPLNVLPWFIKE